MRPKPWRTFLALCVFPFAMVFRAVSWIADQIEWLLWDLMEWIMGGRFR